MKHPFLLCGSVGWCLEVFWTGCHSLFKGEPTMMGNSSLLMFPIYGMAFLIKPLSSLIKRLPLLLRGSIYAAGIFFTEYTTGSMLKKHNMCPWDYSKAPLNYKGLIRLDYAPVWFVTGLLYEKILGDLS
ncbi:MAG: hypothetical protein Q4E89_06580 [Eubacteriales bacterium]|nr:hypothetical protein [Eubacteriales bacterium]